MEMTNGGADEEKKSRYFFDWNGIKFINVILYTRQYALKTIDF